MRPTAAERAARAVAGAEAILVGAGAGMGVDSGLPDFRGSSGFWRAHPAYRSLGLNFAALADPRWFDEDPALAWGFYGHRLGLYRATRPHAGHEILRRWSERVPTHVLTSNVDGQFQRAGFPAGSVYEVHGTLHRLRCSRRCGAPALPTSELEVRVDERTGRATSPLPRCPCGAVTRPDVLMFRDGECPSLAAEQEARFEAFLARSDPWRLVVVECGAGTEIPTVRRWCEYAARRGTLVRVNPREPWVPSDAHVGVRSGALDGLRAIDAALQWIPPFADCAPRVRPRTLTPGGFAGSAPGR